MTQRNSVMRGFNRILILAGASTAVLFFAAGIRPQHTALAASTTTATGENPLTIALDAELKRAMASLGSDGAAAAQQPKPYYLSYAVSDATQVGMAAEYGAITNSTERSIRSVDVQVRLGSPAEDNTHGDHRTSAITTFPLPLTDDRDAIARSLWFATNRGYARALDGFLKVKTEQQVRAKEEDVSADFSAEKAQAAMLPAAPKLNIDTTAWEGRLREISAVFRQYPDIYYDTVGMQTSNETDYFVSSEGAAPMQRGRRPVQARAAAAPPVLSLC